LERKYPNSIKTATKINSKIPLLILWLINTPITNYVQIDHIIYGEVKYLN